MEQSLHIQTSVPATTLQFFGVPLKVKVYVLSLVLKYYMNFFFPRDMKFKAEIQVGKDKTFIAILNWV